MKTKNSKKVTETAKKSYDKFAKVMAIFRDHTSLLKIDVLGKRNSNAYFKRLTIIGAIKDNPKYHAAFIGFIKWCKNNPGWVDKDEIEGTLLHDIIGLANKEKMFSPRVSSYAEYAE